VMPGGGVIPTLVSGKHAAMLLCRRDGKVFIKRRLKRSSVFALTSTIFHLSSFEGMNKQRFSIGLRLALKRNLTF
jgi:hypothetical protein